MNTWTVLGEHAGMRLDRWLADRAQVSRGQVQRWLDSGLVEMDGAAVAANKGGTALQAGGTLTVRPESRDWIGASGVPLRVLARGEGWIALDKPAGVPVHPLLAEETGTLLGALAAQETSVVGVGDEGDLRSGVVHRLDVDTSGVVLFALNDERWKALRQAFSEHRVTKRYRALVAGDVKRDGRRQARLKVTRHRPARVSVVRPGEEPYRRCALAWRVVARGRGVTEVEVDLHTGFLHQVRVMFAAMGHPLLGDAVYAPPEVAAQAPRQMLHAASISVDDVSAASDLPDDFQAARREFVLGV